MATTSTTITAASFCQPNEGHVTLTSTGDISATRSFETKDLKQNVTAQEAGEAMVVLLRWHCRNMSNANAKAAAIAGITVATSSP